jgi:hypothetical protein
MGEAGVRAQPASSTPSPALVKRSRVTGPHFSHTETETFRKGAKTRGLTDASTRRRADTVFGEGGARLLVWPVSAAMWRYSIRGRWVTAAPATRMQGGAGAKATAPGPGQ